MTYNQANFSLLHPSVPIAGVLQPWRNPARPLHCVSLLVSDYSEGEHRVVIVIRLDGSLQGPMYFFLGILSISETCYFFFILPKMLINLLSLLRTISFINCATQILFFLGFAVTDYMLLRVMGYDHSAATCHPLRYPTLMSWQVCGQLAATCAVIVFFLSSLTGSRLVFELLFVAPIKSTTTSVTSPGLPVLKPMSMSWSSSLVEF